MTVKDFLAAKDWGGLARHFASSEPMDATEFQARALVALNDRNRPIDWDHVLADLRQAVALQPDDALVRANLSQALLESRQPEEAYLAARDALKLAPTIYPVIEKLAFAAAATNRWDEALQALRHVEQHLPEGQKLPAPAAALLSQLNLQWWRGIAAGGVTLRRPTPADLDWLAPLFRDAAFMRHYHRLDATPGVPAARKFIELAQLSPFQTRRIDWIVQDREGRARGLAALVDIDWPNRRAELLVGFAGAVPSMLVAGAAAAALAVAFQRVGVHKVVTTAYSDNPRAQRAALHLGFRPEGLLRGHVLAHGSRVDLHVNGMLVDEYRNSELLKKLAQRWSRQDGRVME